MSEQSPMQVQWFQPSGRATGVVSLVVCAVLAVFCVLGGADLAAYGVILVFAVLVYLALLRPRVGTSRDDVVYRGMFSDLRIPLAAIDEMRVTRFFVVVVDGRRFISPAVGRTLRRTMQRQDYDPLKVYADFVEDATHSRMAEARARRAPGAPVGEIHRSWAVPEIAAAVGAVVLLVVLAVV
jgi:hypothetical protein